MPKKFWIGLIIILLFYTIYYLLFVETSYFQNYIPRKVRHLTKFIILILVYLVGLSHLKLDNISWMKTIWHITHITGIAILVGFGFYDWLFTPLHLNTKLLLISINELLIAPTLYVTMGILNTFLLRIK